jgi:hypothetical protein
MALANYTDLKASVASWMARSDLTSQISDFITLAEIRVGRDLRISPLITVAASGSISPGAATVSLPTGFLGMVSVKLTSAGTELKYIAPDTYDRAQSNSNGVTVPAMYTIMGSTLYVSPTWTAGGTLTWAYFKQEVVLSGSNATNWYITNAPDLLLYASLLEASPYIKAEVADVEKWKTFYENARDRLNDQYGVLDAHTRMLNMSAGKGKALTPAI